MENLSLPKSIYAGDTVTITESLADYPAGDGWSLRYVLVNESQKYEFTSSASGNDHAFSVTSATTGAWSAGKYRWACQAINGSERITVGQGAIEIKPDFSAGAVDARHHVEKVLDAIEAILEGKAGSDAYSLEVNGKTLQRYKPEELLVWRDKYKSELRQIKAAENVAAGLNSGNSVHIRFRG